TVLLIVTRRSIGLALVFRELRPIEDPHLLRRLLRRGVAVESDARVAGDPAATRDEHDAIGATRSVDGSRAGIFQHVDRLDIRWIQISDAAGHRNAIQHVERIVRRQDRALAAYAHAHAVTWLVPCRDDVHARHTTLDRLYGVRRRRLLDLRRRNRRLRARDIATLLGAVTDDDDGVELDRGTLEMKIDGRRLAVGHGNTVDDHRLIPEHRGPHLVLAGRGEDG